MKINKTELKAVRNNLNYVAIYVQMLKPPRKYLGFFRGDKILSVIKRNIDN